MKLTLEIVDGMTLDDIDHAYELLNVRRDYLARVRAKTFKVGQKVSFPSRRGMTVKGMVEKIGPKNIIVKPDDDPRPWRVSPNLLTVHE